MLEPIEYLYRPIYRSPVFSAMPKDVQWDFVEAPRLDPSIAVRRHLQLSKYDHGIIATNRALTPEEREEYGMQVV